MERLVQVDREQLAAQLRTEFEQAMAQVMDAVNAAKEGRLIQDSERPVLELMQDLQRRVYQKAVQLRIDSTESSFSPSAGRDGQGQAEQGAQPLQPADAAGAHPAQPHAVLRSRGRKRGSRR